MSSSRIAWARASSRAAQAAGGSSQRRPDEPHLVNGPAQVDGGGPRGQQAARGLLERGPEGGLVGGARGGRRGRERQPAGRGDADGRRAAHRHVGDARGDLLPRAAAHVALLVRQRELVDEHDLAGQDLDGAHAQPRDVAPAPRRCRVRVSHARRRPAQVPWSQEARYLACSSVSVSQATSMVSSLTRAISSSMSLGTT